MWARQSAAQILHKFRCRPSPLHEAMFLIDIEHAGTWYDSLKVLRTVNEDCQKIVRFNLFDGEGVRKTYDFSLTNEFSEEVL